MARPTKMTQETIAKLESAFAWGCTDTEACLFAGIDNSTFYRYCQDNEEFRDKKEALKDTPTMKAKRIINNSLDEQDLATANRVIDRKEGTKVKTELTGKDGGAIETKSIFNFIPVGNDD